MPEQHFPMWENILAQQAALRKVADHALGAGQGPLEQAASLVASARSVVLGAMGASLYACLPLARRLSRSGRRAAAFSAAELLHYPTDHPEAGEVAVLVSRSGESVEVIRLLEQLRDRGVRVIGVTNVAGSPLAQAADVTLLKNSPPDEMVAVQSYTATLLVLALLGEAALHGDLAGCEADLDRLVELGSRLVETYAQDSPTWRPFFEGAQAVYLLARAGALASAQEGALMLHESAKLPAVAMEAAEFRHGPVEVARSAGFRGLLLAPDDHTRPLNIGLAKDLARLGGQVCLVGPDQESEEQPGLHHWPVPVLSETFYPILEIIPLQFAAYQASIWRGLRPGQLRVTGLVTAEETGFPGLKTE